MQSDTYITFCEYKFFRPVNVCFGHVQYSLFFFKVFYMRNKYIFSPATVCIQHNIFNSLDHFIHVILSFFFPGIF